MFRNIWSIVSALKYILGKSLDLKKQEPLGRPGKTKQKQNTINL